MTCSIRHDFVVRCLRSLDEPLGVGDLDTDLVPTLLEEVNRERSAYLGVQRFRSSFQPSPSD